MAEVRIVAATGLVDSVATPGMERRIGTGQTVVNVDGPDD